jgi:hypothetical protein
MTNKTEPDPNNSPANLTLNEEAEFDEYGESVIKNKAHQVVYKSVFEKLRDLSK